MPIQPELSQLKTSVLQSKKYTAREIAELAETTVAALTELQENTQPAPLHGTATLPVSGWNHDNTAGYPYYYDIAIPGVTDRDFAAINFAPSSLEIARACGLCSVNESMAGKVRLRAITVPTAAIQAEYWIQKGKD